MTIAALFAVTSLTLGGGASAEETRKLAPAADTQRMRNAMHA